MACRSAFRTVRGKSDRKNGTRQLLEVDLWEISIVTFPMLQQARISCVKSGALPTMREFERWLVRDAGFTRSNARTVIRSGFKKLASKQDAAGDENKQLVGVMRRAADMMKRTNMTDYENKAASGTDVAGAFDEFMHAFEEFKSTNDERLDQVEKSVSTDVVTEEKLARLNKTMDQMVAKSARPPLAGGAPGSVAGMQHKSAFETYMRKGGCG